MVPQYVADLIPPVADTTQYSLGNCRNLRNVTVRQHALKNLAFRHQLDCGMTFMIT